MDEDPPRDPFTLIADMYPDLARRGFRLAPPPELHPPNRKNIKAVLWIPVDEYEDIRR